MKYWREILLFGFFGIMSSVWLAAAGVIPGIVVSNTVTTGNTANTHPVADSNEILGATMQYQYSSELRTIPESRKRKGMLVYIAETDTIYKAYSTNGHYWTPFTSGGGAVDLSGLAEKPHLTNMSTNWFKRDDSKLDVTVHDAYVLSNNSAVSRKLDTSSFTEYGALIDAQLALKNDDAVFRAYTSSKSGLTKGDKGDPGYDGINQEVVTCSILVNTEGVAGATYDAEGRNPSVTTLGPFEAYLYEGGTLLTQQTISYEWWMPAFELGKTQLVYPPSETDGLQLRRQYFEPRVHDTYSASRSNNIISVQIRYSSIVLPFGKRVCKASLPLNIVQVGPQGLQGQIGPAGGANRAAVQQLFSSATYQSNVPMTFRPLDNYTSSYQIIMRDATPGNARLGINGLGYMKFLDANGFAVRKMETDGTIAILTNNVKRLDLKSDGSMTGYRSNGNTAFKAYSSGYEIWENGALKFRYSPRSGLTMWRDGVEIFNVYSTGKYKGVEGWPTNVTKTRNYTLADGFRGYTSGGSGSSSATLPNPYTLPAAGQTFRSSAGVTKFTFGASGGLTIH